MIEKQSVILLIGMLLLLVSFFVFHAVERRDAFRAETTDALTQAFNRRYIKHFIENGHIGEVKSIALMDVDRFKKLNDAKGHAYGDEILKKTTQSALKVCEGQGVVVRWGGDEFLLLFDVSAEAAMEICNQLREAVAKYNITLSMGLVKNDREASFDSMIEKADQALYQVKQQGRDGVRLYG